MANTTLFSIRLSEEHRARLAQLCETTGRNSTDVLRGLLDSGHVLPSDCSLLYIHLDEEHRARLQYLCDIADLNSADTLRALIDEEYEHQREQDRLRKGPAPRPSSPWRARS